ncbi:MAG TPA: DNA translocase FtsK 4TM domain-containing protein, partial [Burkholderiales bacterium]|nr:DNA translocase FtsK 4TM domain-containing protein [Burkholderiales bacterium]
MSQATWKKTKPALTPRVVRLLREAALYLLAAVGLYLLLSLWTYSANDPSGLFRGPSTAVANLGGRVGAWLADALFWLFGYVAFLFPIMIAIGGWRVYRHRN